MEMLIGKQVVQVLLEQVVQVELPVVQVLVEVREYPVVVVVLEQVELLAVVVSQALQVLQVVQV
jgi:hypothetical protein